MAFKSLLVHVDDSECCSHRLGIASRIAHEFAAQLVGVYLVPTPELTPTIAALLPDSIVQRRLRATGDAQDRAEARFLETAQRANLVTIEWRAPAGDPAEALAMHTRGVDLAVIGQPDPANPGASFDNVLANAAVLSSGRPVLVVPFGGAPSSVGRTVLVGWDHSKESARAVADALPILARAKQVVVVSVTASDEEGPADPHSAAHIESYLRRYGVVAAIRRIEGRGGDAGELLLAQANDVGADLIVIGAYGHTPLRELVLGGVTRTVLTRMTVPVLMAH